MFTYPQKHTNINYLVLFEQRNREEVYLRRNVYLVDLFIVRLGVLPRMCKTTQGQTMSLVEHLKSDYPFSLWKSNHSP